ADLRGEGRLPERRLLLRHRLQRAGHPDRPDDADLRDRPQRRLAVALAGATQEQPHFPPGAGVRRQAQRRVRAAGEEAIIMLDVAFIRDNLAKVKENCENRGVKADVDRVVALDDERKRLASETQKIQQRQNEVSKLIPQEKDSPKKQALIAEGKDL